MLTPALAGDYRRLFFAWLGSFGICLPTALGSPGRYPASFRSPGLSGFGFPAACLRCYGGSDSCRVPLGSLPRQVSYGHCTFLAMPTTTNHAPRPFGALRCYPPPNDPSWGIVTSQVARMLVVLVAPNRVHFCCSRYGSFRCSPPRLTATQLLQVLTSPTVADGRGLSPRKSVQLRSARAHASRVVVLASRQHELFRPKGEQGSGASTSRLTPQRYQR